MADEMNFGQVDPEETQETTQRKAAEGMGELSYPERQELENQLTALEKQRDEYKEALVRTKADAENIRKRAERDVENAHKFGVERLVQDLLPVLDSMSRSLEAVEGQQISVEKILEGLKLTVEMMQNVMKKQGVDIINPQVGERFDPTLHEAMSMCPVEGAASNTVYRVLQPGYLLQGRVLRAAMVMVAQ